MYFLYLGLYACIMSFIFLIKNMLVFIYLYIFVWFWCGEVDMGSFISGPNWEDEAFHFH